MDRRKIASKTNYALRLKERKSRSMLAPYELLLSKRESTRIREVTEVTAHEALREHNC